MSKENPITSVFGKGYSGSIFQKAKEEMINALNMAEKLEKENKQLKIANEILRQNSNEISELKIAKKSLEDELHKCREEIVNLKDANESLEKHNKTYIEELGNLNRKYNLLEDENKNLKHEITTLKSLRETIANQTISIAKIKTDSNLTTTPPKDEIDEVVNWKTIVAYAKEQQKPEVVESIAAMLKDLCLEKERNPKELTKNIKELDAHANQLRKPQPMIQNNHGSQVFSGNVNNSNFNPPTHQKETE